jgi:hypothetical protein
MEEYIDLAFRYWKDFASWSPGGITMYTIVGFSVLSSWVMTRIVAIAPLFAGPISFIVLTFAAMVSNFAARGTIMMGTSDLQKILLFTVLGHAVAGILLLAVFKVGAKSASK